MGKLKNWPLKLLVRFLKDYGFSEGEMKSGSSHMPYYGRINGDDRIVYAISSTKERKCQSHRTMEFAIEHSTIPEEYFDASNWTL